MENATKALLIAAAVLIAILIITLGVVVYQKASETVNGAGDLSEYEIEQFNAKFTKYQGSNVSGSEVNAMVQTVVNHNNAESRAQGNQYVKVTTGSVVTVPAGAVNTMPTKVPTGNRYSITVKMDTDGLVNEIVVAATSAGS